MSYTLREDTIMNTPYLKIAGTAVFIVALGFLLYALFPETNMGVSNENEVGNEASPVYAVLPEGFPTDMPLENAEIQESFSSFYEDTGVHRYMISYVTDENRTFIYEKYTTYLTDHGFEIIQQEENPIYIYAKNENEDITILIEEKSEDVLVTINYTRL